MALNNSGISNVLGYQAANNADVGTRYYGGSNRKDHAFIKGYFQVFFELPQLVSANGSSDPSDSNSVILTASASSFTPHGDRTINKVDIVGQGGVGASFVTGHTTTRTFNINFQEKYKAPIWNIFRKWTTLMIDPYTGLSNLDVFEADQYKGRCMVVETMPVRLDANASEDAYDKNIIKVYYYDGVFPETDISSIFDSNVTSPDGNVEINMGFSFDGQPLDENNTETKQLAITMMKNASLYSQIMDYYNNLYLLD